MDSSVSKKAFPKSPIRWAGSKFALLKELAEQVPKNFNRYVEPMFGSGALFYALKPKKALINDLNGDLYCFLSTLKTKGDKLIIELLKLEASREMYYKMRAEVAHDDLSRAIRFLYLNRLSWNGIYRVNKNGEFNVPFGNRCPKVLWSKKVLTDFQETLKHAEISNDDYANLIDRINENDFVFLDPPYPKNENGIGFNRYTLNFFSIEEHERLYRFITAIIEKGAFVMLTLSDNQEILSKYPIDFKVLHIETKSLISCNGSSRKIITECILTNF